jgi:hypothetical protein
MTRRWATLFAVVVLVAAFSVLMVADAKIEKKGG